MVPHGPDREDLLDGERVVPGPVPRRGSDDARDIDSGRIHEVPFIVGLAAAMLFCGGTAAEEGSDASPRP